MPKFAIQIFIEAPDNDMSNNDRLKCCFAFNPKDSEHDSIDVLC